MRGALIVAALACGVVLENLHAWATSGHAWATSTVPYYVNTQNDKGLTGANIVSDLRNAAAVWPTQANVNVQLQYAGATTATTLALDYKNNVFFRNDTSPYGYMAETYYWYDGSNHLVDFDMVWHEGGYG